MGNLVTSLETSQKLQELGVEKESLFYWFENRVIPLWQLEGKTVNKYNEPTPAYTTNELLEMIPSRFDASDQTPEDLFFGFNSSFNGEKKWFKTYLSKFNGIPIIDSVFIRGTPQEALAQVLIYLLENNYIKASEL